MDDKELELLDAIHKVDKRVVNLESKIDDSVNGRFKDNERRLTKLEDNQRWLVLAFVGAIVGAIMKLVLE
ncbi:hemolysin XhlA family protein [Erysipelothrix amsterdamensis]|uniref:Hemolysin XhlA family protein n=1 Tax=Erysipelothrix amsterdamensis TaxID=2929157 RepID=A0AAU9VIK2_9FIRM|nr:hemolysin XhlA family protein [Erysipelothrix sp. 4322-04]WRB86668.1 hemolysin XhlA family protein [Erysipelothrix sp. 4322-04]CAH2762021.1 hemolysin XhlA family protein [Erysipelothrix sp. A18Y020d]CAH2762036.1 hemolysin XhlA family protein [Erysipelothrix sp. A18Y020d]